MKPVLGLLVIIFVLLTGCSIQTSPVAPTLIPPTLPLNPTLTPSPSPTSPVIPAVPLVTPTDPGPDCLPARPQGSFAPVSFADLPAAILEFLNQGGTIEVLDASLYEQDMANQPIAVAGGDLTGNGKTDVIVSVYNPDISVWPPQGKLLIYICQDAHYNLAYSDTAPELFGAPIIRYLQDLNADGQEELITSASMCGAHTCFEEIKILAWTGEKIENVLLEQTDDLPYPVIDLLPDEDTGIYEVQITGSGYGSAGAGPQRSHIRKYSFVSDIEEWQFTGEQLGESNYRIHVLHDADQAALDGNYDESLLLYQRVIDDTTLDDWVDPEEEQAILSAYARFRMIVLYQLKDQPTFANMVLNDLENTYPSGHPQHSFVELAQAFMAGLERNDIHGGCNAARSYSAANEDQVLEVLGYSSFGYANPTFEPEDICPW